MAIINLCAPISIDSSTLTAPPKVEFPSMIADPVNQRLVMYGGLTQSGNTYQSQTSTWQGSGPWQLAATGTPTARAQVAMGMDANLNILVFGGYDGSYLNDTWLYKKGVWTVTSNPTAPAPVAGCAVASSDVTKLVYLFGGYDGTSYNNNLWVWSGSTWNRFSGGNPPARANACMVYNSKMNVLVLFGGKNASGNLNDLWVYDGTSWSQITANTAPSARWGASMVYMPNVDKTVLFGGHDGVSPLEDTWILSGSSWWTNKKKHLGPSARVGAACAYNAPYTEAILYGGRSSSNASLGDTWSFNGDRWALVQSPTT